MGTNVAPIYTNIYMAMLENELKLFIDDGLLMMVLVSPKEIEKTFFTEFKNSMNYEKLFKLTNIIGELLLIIWTFSYTKATPFIEMANFQSLIKKRLISL